MVVTWVVGVIISMFTKPKTDDELEGLTFATGGMKYFRTAKQQKRAEAREAVIAAGEKVAWYRRPLPIGIAILVISLALYIPFF